MTLSFLTSLARGGPSNGGSPFSIFQAGLWSGDFSPCSILVERLGAQCPMENVGQLMECVVRDQQLGATCLYKCCEIKTDGYIA